jgi:hypothetical protein
MAEETNVKHLEREAIIKEKEAKRREELRNRQEEMARKNLMTEERR